METEETPLSTPHSPRLHRRSQFLAIYALFAILDLLGNWSETFALQLAKPVPLIMLTIFSSLPSTHRKEFYVGFLFSLIGDVLLMAKTEFFFMVGTGAFLVAHLSYITGFSFTISLAAFFKRTSRLLLAVKLSLLAFIWSLFIFNAFELWHKIPNRFLFLVYGLVLTLMPTAAILRRQNKTNSSAYWTIVSGAILFCISDNSLAFCKFNNRETSLSDFFVMLTYYLAQLLIYLPSTTCY